MAQIIFATSNPNKLREINELLNDTAIPGLPKIIGLAEIGYHKELQEDHNTLQENAKQKAEFIYQKFGLPCFSEDTGLEIDALHGEPGVRSARYAGPDKTANDNMQLVLYKLGNSENRSAAFRSVLAYTENGKEFHYFVGEVIGTIADHPIGHRGFGYDPIFIPDGYAQTFGQLPDEVKRSLSHRSRAFQKLVQHILSNQDIDQEEAE